MSKLTLSISGMSCAGCARNVRRLLSGVPGISVADVQLAHAMIEVDPLRVSPVAVTRALADAGYAVTSTQASE